MGTRSRIGIQLKDSSVVSVYCHWDGYPAHNGKILTEEYTTREDVENLINGGSISSLKTRETWNSGSSLRRDDGSYITDEKGHMMFENDRTPQPLYHAERGEEINVEHTDFDTFASGDLGGEEYAYLFTLDNTWKCYATNLFQPTTPVEIP